MLVRNSGFRSATWECAGKPTTHRTPAAPTPTPHSQGMTWPIVLAPACAPHTAMAAATLSTSALPFCGGCRIAVLVYSRSTHQRAVRRVSDEPRKYAGDEQQVPALDAHGHAASA